MVAFFGAAEVAEDPEVLDGACICPGRDSKLLDLFQVVCVRGFALHYNKRASSVLERLLETQKLDPPRGDT